MQNKFDNQMKEYLLAIEAYLASFFSEKVPQQTLFDAMRYSLLAGGKRIRPVFTLEFCRICGGDWQKALPFAAAIEMVHTYSLIHDDLPCMDNDDYRRGRLTNHKVYGEATAVLAGDALLTAAFSCISYAQLSAQARIKAVETLAHCAGECGMVGGQVLDIEGETRALTAQEVNIIHELKTGCLIMAACKLGVIAAEGTDEQLAAAEQYAKSLGLAFQIRDDVLDAIGDAKLLGKTTNMDAEKTTFVKLYGVEECAKLVQNETQRAITSLSSFDDSCFLQKLAADMATRDH